MPPIRFTRLDAEILYCIPKPPVDLAAIIGTYVFINRAGVPRYEELQGCLSRALNAGILRQAEEKFTVDESWYEVIHAADRTAENEIDSMIVFEDWLIQRDFLHLFDSGYHLSKDEYQFVDELW